MLSKREKIVEGVIFKTFLTLKSTMRLLFAFIPVILSYPTYEDFRQNEPIFKIDGQCGCGRGGFKSLFIHIKFTL